jgi:hypothetical protein
MLLRPPTRFKVRYLAVFLLIELVADDDDFQVRRG